MKNSAGQPRRAGFELEFGNLTVRETAEALQRDLGGDIQEKNPFYFKLTDSSAGNLKIERDAELLHSVRYRKALRKINVDFNPDTLANEIEQGIDRLSCFLIPCEIVTEPLSFREFPNLDRILNVLDTINAKGTQNSVFYAFGLHINPSVPDSDKKTLVAYMQSFLLLAEWLEADSDVDFSRRFFTNFIDPFPDDYVKKVLDPEYRPDTDTFTDDYLRFNPTRNRALDMLPLLADIDNERVLAGVKKEEHSLIRRRPAFHYRLPDCRLGDKTWSPADEWNRWWYVEAVASDPGLRDHLMNLRHKTVSGFLISRKRERIDIVKHVLNSMTTPNNDDNDE